MQIITDSNCIVRIAQITGTNWLATKASIIGAGRFCQARFDSPECSRASSDPSAPFLVRREKMGYSSIAIVTSAKIPRMDWLPTKTLIKCHGWFIQTFAYRLHNWLWRRPFLVIVRMAKVNVLALREHLKILDAIIMTVTVFMMHYFFRKQGATKVLLHDAAMLKLGTTINAHINIARLSLPRDQICRASSPQSCIMFLAEAMSKSQIRAVFNGAYL